MQRAKQKSNAQRRRLFFISPTINKAKHGSVTSFQSRADENRETIIFLYFLICTKKIYISKKRKRIRTRTYNWIIEYCRISYVRFFFIFLFWVFFFMEQGRKKKKLGIIDLLLVGGGPSTWTLTSPIGTCYRDRAQVCVMNEPNGVSFRIFGNHQTKHFNN